MFNRYHSVAFLFLPFFPRRQPKHNRKAEPNWHFNTNLYGEFAYSFKLFVFDFLLCVFLSWLDSFSVFLSNWLYWSMQVTVIRAESKLLTQNIQTKVLWAIKLCLLHFDWYLRAEDRFRYIVTAVLAVSILVSEVVRGPDKRNVMYVWTKRKGQKHTSLFIRFCFKMPSKVAVKIYFEMNYIKYMIASNLWTCRRLHLENLSFFMSAHTNTFFLFLKNTHIICQVNVVDI